MNRKLIDGSEVPELTEAQTLMLKTKCPTSCYVRSLVTCILLLRAFTCYVHLLVTFPTLLPTNKRTHQARTSTVIRYIITFSALLWCVHLLVTPCDRLSDVPLTACQTDNNRAHDVHARLLVRVTNCQQRASAPARA